MENEAENVAIEVMGEIGASESTEGFGWKDLFPVALKAGGEIASKKIAADKAKQADANAARARVAAGEAVFKQMKDYADAAKWPADLSPQITLLDKSWQTSKGSGDAGTIDNLRMQMQGMVAQLAGRLGASPGVPGAGQPATVVPYTAPAPNFLSRKYGPLVVWQWGLGAALLTGAGLYLKSRAARP